MDPTQQPTHPPSDPSPMAQPPLPQNQTPPSSSQPPTSPSPLPPTPPLSAPPIAPSTNPNPSKTLTPLLQPESQPQPQPHHHQQQQQAQQLELDHKQELHDQQFSGFQGAQNRPALARHWQQPSHMSPFQPHLLPGIPGPSTSAATSSPSPIPSSLVSATPRGGTAIGVPAMRPGMSPQPNAFSTSFGYGMVPRNPANASEPPSSSAPSMVRPALHGVQTMGMIGSQMQAGVLTGNHQHRPQLSYRPQSSSVNQPSPSQNFQGQGIMRPSSMGSVTSTSQGPSSQNQTWLTHGRPPITIPPSRPPLNPQSLQQKSQMTPQLHHVMPPPALQQQQIPSFQQQHQPSKSLNQQREHPGPQLSAPRVHVPPSSSSQPTRVQGSANLKSSLTAVPQPSTLQPVMIDTVPAAEIDESNKRIIGKRSIQELVNQIDPSEKLDPEVEDILIDIAEEFVESITTFGCSLAKHRQSSTLEAKDILLHLERNWNMTLPGFCGDEIKTFKKPVTNDLHRERLTIVRKSVAGADMGNTKSSAGQASINAKGHVAKTLPNASGP
ncbi:hypothetical protein V2J09_012213 [Rumex salicifolius]